MTVLYLQSGETQVFYRCHYHATMLRGECELDPNMQLVGDEDIYNAPKSANDERSET